MPRRRTIEPFAQGDLDGLCGAYAIINAIRLALGERAGEFNEEDWNELFGELLITAGRSADAAVTIIGGMTTKQLRRLLKFACRYMHEQHSIAMDTQRPLKGMPAAHCTARLRDLAQEPGTAVIVSLEGHFSHWSVLRSIGDGAIVLFDSGDCHRLRLANCRFDHQRRRRGREHIIHRKAVFSITVTGAP